MKAVPDGVTADPAGVLTIGVGFRVLNEEISKEYLDSVGYRRADAAGTERTYEGQDGGVSLHVLGPGRDGDLVEYFRLDCFEDEPHYHYVYNDERAAIKKRVNLALGSRIVEEKSYKQYRAEGAQSLKI